MGKLMMISQNSALYSRYSTCSIPCVCFRYQRVKLKHLYMWPRVLWFSEHPLCPHTWTIYNIFNLNSKKKIFCILSLTEKYFPILKFCIKPCSGRNLHESISPLPNISPCLLFFPVSFRDLTQTSLTLSRPVAP